ncbi:MAG TPA: NADPH-dependent assimilatory sulfite reductase hemoprotein subunit [Casimicrobiaceae bacterium]|nr:NADPH-dependent assimilatory sulfite reductase hemoprotein subunit [Casimicrobiaceae bacterium]
MNDTVQAPPGRSEVERVKEASDYLRGTIVQSLANPITGALADSDAQLIKFHGSYQQDDRDLRDDRRRRKLEPLYSFMVRVRAPGGVVTPWQWLVLDELARTHANGSLRLTTRQSFQLHGIRKPRLKETIAAVNETLLTTIAACGDVNRNVMCNPNPYQSALHGEVFDWASRISEELEPKTRAYHEIWLDDALVAGGEPDDEPLYGRTYLPRKFKIAIAVPPSNDVDVFAHDLGFIAIVDDNGSLAGFNVTVGGGMGMTHGEPATYPRLGDVIGSCRPGQMLAVTEQVVAIQRDYGDRSDRKHARLKYTIDDRGVDWFSSELAARLGTPLDPPRPFRFEHNGDRYGWVEGVGGKLHLTLFVENGRVRDTPSTSLMTGLREIAKAHDGDFRLTANQNLIIANVDPAKRPAIESLLAQHRVDVDGRSGMRVNSMACVALPTCGLAMAESERYLPTLIGKLERILDDSGLADDAITVRMTGCPNGCARPYVAEIAFVGKSPGKYNVYLGGGFAGDRLNKLYRSALAEDEILAELAPIIRRYASDRRNGERFGDFVIRAGYVEAVTSGRTFHA